MAQRMTTYLKQNNFTDTSIQKAGISGFLGCLEHTSMMWHQIQSAKREGRDLPVLFLDLANAFGSVPHSLLWTALDFFHMPTTRDSTSIKHPFQRCWRCQSREYKCTLE